MERPLSLLTAAALALTLSGCTAGPAEPAPSPTPESVATPAPTPEPAPEPTPGPSIWGSQGIRTAFPIPDGSGGSFQAGLSLPFVGGTGPTWTAVNAYYRDRLAEEADSAREWASRANGHTPCYVDVDSGLASLSEGLVSFWVSSDGYGGGVHGFYRVETDCFDRSTGARLALPDLFTDYPAARERILAEIEGQLRFRYAPFQDDFAVEPLRRAEEQLDGASFFLSPESLTIHFNEYDIGAYAEGPFDFLVPAHRLADLMSYPEWEPQAWRGETFTQVYPGGDGAPLLTVDLTVPQALSRDPAPQTVGDFYAALLSELSAEMTALARASASTPQTNAEFTPCWAVDLDFTVPFQNGQLVSFRRVRRDYTGSSTETVWSAETFSLETGRRLTFADLFTVDAGTARARVWAEVEPLFLRRHGEGESAFFLEEDLARFSAQFDPQRFYLTGRGLVFFTGDGYESYEVPYASLTDVLALDVDLPAAPVQTPPAYPSSSGLPPLDGPWGCQTVRTDYFAQDGTRLLELDLSLPYGGRPEDEAVNAYCRALLEDLTAGAEEEAAYLAEHTDLVVPQYSYLLVSGGPVYETGDLVSLSLCRESYGAGAAHPLHSNLYPCLERATGRELALSDLFADYPAARRVIWDALLPQLQTARPAEWVPDTLVWAEEQLDETPFFLREDALVLHYNEYAIASYVEGSFDFPVPAEALSGLTAYPIWPSPISP